MLQLQSPKEIRKRAHAKGLIKSQSHIQKKYFSLMLVPSYSSGKTRSIRIPYMAFYVLFATVAIIGATILFLHFRAQSLMQVAQYTAETLEQYQEAYVNLQELTEEERRQLTEENIAIRSALNQQRMLGEEQQYRQRLTYLETLEALQAYVEGLEDQLGQFEIYRQEILDRLSLSAHIPPVRNMLNEMFESQIHLLATLDDLQSYAEIRRERSGDMILLSASPLSTPAETAADDLFNYIAMLELTLETKIQLYSQLEEQVGQIVPYIRNYPTTRPIHGRLTSGFGWRRNPMGGGGSEMHRGVDIAAPSGTLIRATGGGTVVFSAWSGAYGNKVIIDHGMGIRSLYAHNSTNLVQVGDEVSRGDTIARVGSTGRSTGPHVHYEVLVNGTAVNPNRFFLE